MLLKIWKNKENYVFSSPGWMAQSWRPRITWPMTRVLFLPLVPTPPWILLRLFVLWSSHNRCLVGILVFKGEKEWDLCEAQWWWLCWPIDGLAWEPLEASARVPLWWMDSLCEPHTPQLMLRLRSSGVTSSHSALENSALAEGSLPSPSQQGVSLLRVLYWSGNWCWHCVIFQEAICFSGQHLRDSGHHSRGSNRNVIEVTAGSSSVMKVDVVGVARSGGGSPDDLSVAIQCTSLPLHFPFHSVLELCFRQVACGSGLGRWLWRGFSPHRDMCDKLSWQGCYSNISSSLEEMGEIHLGFDQFSASISGLSKNPLFPTLFHSSP